MGVAINRDVLCRELARRGWTGVDLARAAHVSNATVSSACAGKRVSPVTLRLIAEALAAAPTLREIESLLL